MKQEQRILWAVAIILIDLFTIAVPLTAFVAGYILIARPAWFKDWVAKIYE